MAKKFTRTIEDFSCEHCGARVNGDGYTNHCPKCFYSKHVDVHPGDRASACGGLMAPVEYLVKNGEEKLKQRCLICGHERLNRLSKDDNRDKLIEIIKQLAVNLFRSKFTN
jgi:hypothetical protein